ncbi:hypothetical protein O3G_MSEX000555 [Manduca sexta]|nr:hypothetical protein O3G_MSEX000555 [Manduca sexta]
MNIISRSKLFTCLLKYSCLTYRILLLFLTVFFLSIQIPKIKCHITTQTSCPQSLALLQDHSWTHTNSKQFRCLICDKRFQRQYRLIAHRRLHAAARHTHACRVCDKRFTTASNMQRHMFSHTGLKPFKCEMCGKGFKHASEKRVHITYVHLKKPWPKRAKGKLHNESRQVSLLIFFPLMFLWGVFVIQVFLKKMYFANGGGRGVPLFDT